MSANNDFTGIQPRQDLTAEEIEERYKGRFGYKSGIDAWYSDCVRWGVGFFNINRKPFETNQNSYSGPTVWGFNGEADRAYRNFRYFQGDQSIDDYGWLTQVSGGGEMIAPWQPGKEINRFVKYVANTYLKIARNSKPIVKSYDYKTQSKLKKRLDLAMLVYDLKPYFDKLNEDYGVDFNPSGAREATSKQQITKQFFQNPTTTAEIYGTELLNVIKNKNNFINRSFLSFINMLVGGRAMIESTKQNGWPVWDVIPSWNQISQGIEDDDYGGNDQARGWIRSFAPQDLVTRQGMRGKTWGQQIVEKYGKTALDKVLQGDYNYLTAQMPIWGGWRFRWFNQTQNQIRTMSVARIYWKSLVDTRMLPDKEDPDNKVYFINAKSKKKGTFVEVWRTATLIGNRFVVDEGVCDEVRDPMDESKLYCPIQVFQPYTFMGYNNSLVENVRTIQDDLSMLDYKFREMVGFDMGVVLSILGGKVQGDTDAYAIMEELKKTRILVERSTGDPDNPLDNRPTISRVDYSTASVAAQYLDLWKRKETMMKDILNVSDIALGTQKSYVGFDTQQSTMDASSNNLQYLFYGHAQFMNNLMQYSLEQMKIMISSGETSAGDQVIGERGVYFIKEMKKNLFGSLLCRVDIEDFIDESRKKMLLGNLTALMQTGQVDIVDLIKIEQMQTWSEMTSYVEWKYEQNKADAEQKNLFDKIMSTINVNRQAQAQEQIASNQSEAAIAMKQADVDAKLAGKMLDYDAKTEGGGSIPPEELAAALQGAAGGGGVPMMPQGGAPMMPQGGGVPMPQ